MALEKIKGKMPFIFTLFYGIISGTIKGGECSHEEILYFIDVDCACFSGGWS